MIDINELRRLAQAATPGPWINHGRQPNVAGLPHSAVAAKTLLARVYSEAYGDVEQETANASFIAAANPATISELLDRLEAVEKERDAARKITDSFALALNTSNHKRYALRTKIEAMEKQEPVAMVVSKCGDPESFGERELEVLIDIQALPYDTPFYASPVERQWVDLTDDELKAALEVHQVGLSVRIGRIAIAAFKEKNK